MQVIITRAGDDAHATARQVADLGCTPVPAPLATRLAMPVTIPDQAFDGIIITSRAGLAMLDQAQRAPLQSIPVFCAGDASAALARQAGFATVLSAASDVAGLINLIRETLPRGRSLLYLTGEPRKPDIEQAFSETMRLTTLVTYMMQTARVFPPEALALLVDPHPVWLHYSQQSVVRAAALAAASPQPDLFGRARHLLISAALKEHVTSAGGRDITIAARPDQQAMLDSLLTMRKALTL